MSVQNFFDSDFVSTLFPMEMSRFLIKNGEQKIRDYIQRCLSKKIEDNSCQFLAQTRVYASKAKYHLRRTVKLDPVAEFFIYDILYKNRNNFRKPFHSDKKHFGYRFDNGKQLSISAAYKAFKQALYAYEAKYEYAFSFDVASYFNSIYHHDIVSWFANLDNIKEDDVNALGTFLRQINSGRSIDCLPQGMYPTKMIGNDFLRFIEHNPFLKSDAIIRFMDDVTLFSNNYNTLISDFYIIQKLLGQKGLSVNPNKSKFKDKNEETLEIKVDKVKANLLQRRDSIDLLLYIEDFESAFESTNLTDDELKYIRNLLKEESFDEENATLILSLFSDYPEEVQPHILNFALSFPYLAKNIWMFCTYIKDKDFIGDLIQELSTHDMLQEYQLFWFAWILQDHIMGTKYAPIVIANLYNHKNATIISRAKILEIPDNRYGLQEMRDENLVAGRSDWLAWASAVGHRTLPPICRNHKLEYFGNSSEINYLIKEIITSK